MCARSRKRNHKAEAEGQDCRCSSIGRVRLSLSQSPEIDTSTTHDLGRNGNTMAVIPEIGGQMLKDDTVKSR